MNKPNNYEPTIPNKKEWQFVIDFVQLDKCKHELHLAEKSSDRYDTQWLILTQYYPTCAQDGNCQQLPIPRHCQQQQNSIYSTKRNQE